MRPPLLSRLERANVGSALVHSAESGCAQIRINIWSRLLKDRITAALWNFAAAEESALRDTGALDTSGMDASEVAGATGSATNK